MRPPARLWWALTARCPQRCAFCRVDGRPDQPIGLPEQTLLRIADEAVAMAIPAVILTGGEPRAHPAWGAVSRRLADGGVSVELFTAGVDLGPAALDAIEAAGVRSLRLSLEGLGPAHDARRPWVGGSGFDATLAGLARARDRGLPVTVVTAVGADTLADLPALGALLEERGASAWSVQLRSPGGRDGGDLLDRDGVARVVAILRTVAARGRLPVPLHCSIGYGGPEEALRAGGPWRGAPAGRSGMALTAAGGLLGCPCLPDEFTTGSALDTSLAHLWTDDRRFPYSRTWSLDRLSGACSTCEKALQCKAGCLGMAYRTTGAVGMQSLCLHQDRWQKR